ncbi:MAG: hypothetical protein ABR574_11660, partial [Cryomorphaceae bacterium]
MATVIDAFAQDHIWSRSLPGRGLSTPENLSPGQNLSKGLALDSDHNVYIAGYSVDTVDFDPGPEEALQIAGYRDIYFAKYDSAGNYLWAHVLATDGYNRANHIATDTEGNAVIIGHGSNPADFNPGPGEAILGNDGDAGFYGFLAKYNTNGSYLWAVELKSILRRVTTDPDGNIYVTGAFSQSFDIDPGPGELILNPGSGGICIAKFSPAGELIWAQALSGAGNLGTPTSLSFGESENLLIAGSFGNTVDFDTSPAEYNLAAETASDRFFAMYTSDGALVWARGINVNGYWAGGGGSPEYIGIRENADGDIIVAGNFKETVDFDPGPQSELVFTGLNRSTFFAKYNSDGNFLWVKAIHSTFTQVYDLEIG